jgi:predicted RNase H-like HicB family nuclease
MRTVIVRYHQEPEGWWAETDVLPTFSAAGASYEEVKERVREALPDLLGEPVELLEDVTEVGAEVPVTFHVPVSGAPSVVSVRASLGRHGFSETRGPVSVSVGATDPRPVGQSRNERLELA